MSEPEIITRSETRPSGPLIDVNQFRWRDREGNFHLPQDMETRHLFYVTEMIWNHFMPEEATTRPYRRYSFGSFYTPYYMKMALWHCIPIVLARTDRTPYMDKTLEFMMQWIGRNRGRLSEPLRSLSVDPKLLR